MAVSPSERESIVGDLRAAGCVFAEEEADLLLSAASSSCERRVLVDRRVQGTPLEYVLGWAEFCGLRIALDDGVFVPRRRTEFLVAQAAALIPENAVIIDLCCGSGAISRAMAAAIEPTPEGAQWHAADIDPVAVRCARRNLADIGGQVHEGDLFAPLPDVLRGRVDVLVVNAPYVPHDQIDLLPPEARVYEPHVALDGGSDGLDVHRRVAAAACSWLAAGGYLLIETSERQARTAAQLFAEHGLLPQVRHDEELGATVVIGRSPAVTRKAMPSG